MGKWTPKAKPDILFSRVETAGEMKYVFNARPHLLSSPPRRGNSYWPVLDLQMTVRQILSRDFSRRWRTIHLLRGRLEPFGKRRKEFGKAKGRTAERAGASESTPG
jgi:hypothetical protein